MAIIQRKSFYNNSYVNYFSNVNSFTFEFSYKLFGSNHSYVSQNKELKVIVPKITADALFICSSESLGVLFIDKPVKIYITLPVYEQILLRLEQLPRYLDYDEESTEEDVYNIENINLEMFKANCIFVNHNQIIEFCQINIKCITSGTFIGWSNWIIQEIEQNSKYGIVKNMNFAKRFSNTIESLKCDYIVLFDDYHNEITTDTNHLNLNDFTEKIIENAKGKETIIIPVEMTNIFLELIIHVLAIIQKNNLHNSIAVCSTIFNKLSTVINIQSEWLNSKFTRTICKGKEPFALNDYPNFTSYNSIYDLEKQPDILFVDEFEYKLLNMEKLFDNQTVIGINQNVAYDYLLKLQLVANYEEMLEKNTYATFITSEQKEKSIVLKNGEYLCFEDRIVDHDISITKCNKIDAHNNGNKLQFIIEGFIVQKDGKITIDHNKSQIKELFYNKSYMFINGKYYFLADKKIITILEDKFIIENL